MLRAGVRLWVLCVAVVLSGAHQRKSTMDVRDEVKRVHRQEKAQLHSNPVLERKVELLESHLAQVQSSAGVAATLTRCSHFIILTSAHSGA
jgi:hypothetical protein